MVNAYMYPVSARNADSANPYLRDFMQSLSEDYCFVNENMPSNLGILDIFKYMGRLKMVFFNWVEDLPDKRAGLLQTILLLILLVLFRIMKIKVFYTLHNKDSHYTHHLFLKKLIRNSMLRSANYILCHSSEGLEILSRKYRSDKIRYIPHPFKSRPGRIPPTGKVYDILIWGSIRPYKGIDQYLAYLRKNDLSDKYKTLIIGKIFPLQYENEISGYASEQVKIENRYVDDHQLNELIHQSRIILFTYVEKSVLSSGALIHSLSQGGFVIGPNVGSFRDLHQEKLIEVFDNYSELTQKIDRYLDNPAQDLKRLNDYIEKNTWEAFAVNIRQWINE